MTKLSFYIDDHALLFAWLARAAMQNEPDSALGMIEAWVTTYGRERGSRSAKRCISDGQSLSVLNYFVYSEWHDERGWNCNKVVSLAPYHFKTTECGWDKTWQERGLREYGKLYCRWVDYALVEGFNPDLRLRMDGTLSAGDGQCNFFWPDSVLSESDLEIMAEKRAGLHPKVTRDFLYHLAHLYDSLRRVLIPRIGLERAEAILEQGLRDYENAFGREKLKAVLKAGRQSFSML